MAKPLATSHVRGARPTNRRSSKSFWSSWRSRTSLPTPPTSIVTRAGSSTPSPAGVWKWEIVATPGAPWVYGELTTPGATSTLLFYAHYDGQPADPARWIGHTPWEPVFRNGSLDDGAAIVPTPAAPIPPDWRIYARSASDDRSPIVMMLTALDALRDAGISPRANIKFLFEGEEEAGSPQRQRLHAAACRATTRRRDAPRRRPQASVG